MWIEVAVMLLGLSQDAPKEAAAIRAAKQAVVRTIDPATPQMSFEAWLKEIVVSASTTWEVNDCGEQSGDPQQDKGRDFPMCAEAIVALSGQRELHVSLLVGTFKKGAGGQPQLWSAYVKERNGTVEAIPRLSNIASAIRSAPVNGW